MASYIDNINANSAVAAPQAFTPDWSFLGKTQTALTDMQRKGFEDFRSQYSTFLNSDLSREDNIALREQFKKQADQTISRVAGTDLTDPRNVASAKGIFQPLVNNTLYTKDILVTKQLKAEYMKGQSLMNAANDEVRAAYNPYSLQELQYAIDDFKSMDSQSALTFTPPSYLNNVNLEALAQKYYDEKGWDVSIDSIQGSGNRQYIVTDKNGKVIEADVYRYLQSRFSTDPLVQANLALKSRINRRQYVDANLEMYGGDRNAATAAYIKERYDDLGQEAQQALAEQNSYIESLEYATKEIQEDIERNGAPVTQEKQEIYEDIMSKYGNAQVENSTRQNPEMPQLSDNPTSQELLDAVSALDALEYNQGIAEIAHSLAYTKASTSIKADPYAKIQFEKDLALRNAMALEQEKARLKALTSMMGSQGMGANAPVNLGAGTARENMGDGQYGQYVDHNNSAIAEQSTLTRQQGAQAIADWARLTGQAVLDQNGNPISDDRIASLPNDLFNTYIEKVRAVVTSGSRLKDDPDAALELSAKLTNYDQSYNLNQKLVQAEQNNLIEAINRYTPQSDSEREDIQLFKEIVADGYTDFQEIREEFIKRSEADGSESFGARMRESWNEVYGGVQSIPEALYAGARGIARWVGRDAGDRFDIIFGGREAELVDVDTWSSDAGTISNYYYDNAVDLRGLKQGINVGVGGIERVGTNLGFASNKGSNVNQFVGIANQAVLGEGGTTAIGNIRDYMGGEVAASEIADRVLRDITNILTTKTSGNSTARNMSVTIYRDPVTGKQYMNIIPDNKTLGELTGSKNKRGYAYDQRTKLQKDGITVALEPSSQIPENLYSQIKSPVLEYMNLNNGAYVVGGSNPFEGGQITITRNMSGGFDYSGYLYEFNSKSGKFVQRPLTKEQISTIKNSNEPIDNIVMGLRSELKKQAKENIQVERQ